MSGVVLERDRELAALLRAARSPGHVALVRGEAGIGKSTLVAALREALPPDARLLVGHCDDLATARVLGPLRDLAPSAGGELAHALREGYDRDRLYPALLAELTWPGHATVLVVEDVHWADDATLDVLRLLVRRVAQHPVLLVLTFRDDLPRDHPLHRLLALAHAGPVTDLPLGPLSPDAVGRLGGDGRLHALSGGNPFFVHELLTASRGSVPASVTESVLARLEHLSPATRHAVDQLSVLTAPAGRELVEAVVPDALATLAEAEEHGLLHVSAPGRVAFRHELTRRAVQDALPAARRWGLNARVLATLERLGGSDPAVLVHHAAESGDVEAVVRHGPAAARAATDGGAHREAAAHYRLVLGHRDAFTDAELADLLQCSAIECYAVGDHGRFALDDLRESVALRRTLGDPRALGTGLRWLSRIAWWAGDRATAEEAGAEAVAVLTPSAAPDELALAHSNLSQLAMLGARTAEAVDHARRAIVLAREVGDVQVLMHALNNLGTARWNAGDVDGRTQLEESLALALEHDQDEHACRAFCNIVWQLLADGRLEEAAAYVDQGITHAERAEHVVFWKYLHVEKAMVALARGSWDEAVALAATGMDATPPIRSSAVTVLGSVAVRTGRAEVLGRPAADLVGEAWSLSVGLDELQRTGPAALLVCEEAWLRDDLATLTSVAQRVHDEAERLGSADVRERMACWLTLGGVPTRPGRGSAYDLVRAGRHREAAAAFAEQGFVHEAGWALSLSEDTGDLLEALARLDAIGAVPLAARVRRTLRGRGTPGVPRGPRAETRADPAGLTARQAEVLGLLGQGCSNAEIAARLVLSVRTVDHHVAAVLHKLGASSRQEAVRLAGPS